MFYSQHTVFEQHRGTLGIENSRDVLNSHYMRDCIMDNAEFIIN